MPVPLRIAALGLDADDTLWHSEDGFHASEDRFAAAVAPWADAATAKARLLETEKRNVAVYGYGVKGHVLSAIECAVELSAGRIPAEALAGFVDHGRWMLSRPTVLIDGVAEAVHRLSADHPLIVVTKGDPHHQLRKVAECGLEHLFSAVEVVPEKDPSVYADLLDRHGVDPERFVMVGNSVRSDVLPVIELGGHAVHIPYSLTWGLEHADPVEVARYVATGRFHSLASISELPALLDRLAAA